MTTYSSTRTGMVYTPSLFFFFSCAPYHIRSIFVGLAGTSRVTLAYRAVVLFCHRASYWYGFTVVLIVDFTPSCFLVLQEVLPAWCRSFVGGNQVANRYSTLYSILGSGLPQICY